MTNTNYTDYPFTSNGIDFISRVMKNSPFYKTVSELPEGVFNSMNAQAISELIGDVSLLTQAELVSELERLNDGGTHSFVMLKENA